MIKAIVALTLSSLCLTACAQAPTTQSETAGQAASPDQTQAQAQAETQEQAQPPSTPEPAPPPPPAFREVTIPAGTSLSVTLLGTVASNTSKVEDPITGAIAKDVAISGVTALPVGTQMLGSVTDAEESGRVKGRASVAFRFDRLVVDGETIRVQTAPVEVEAAAGTKSDVRRGALGAGAGAIVGGVLGGGTGAAVGAAAGGAGTVLATKGSEVEIPSGTVVSVLVQNPITVRVALK